jgi:4-oxalocrotonate tautomerase family enzyme
MATSIWEGRKESIMPFVNIKVLKGTLSDEKKKEMIARVTEIVAEIEARPMPKEKLQPHTWCIIEEVDFGSFGIGGVAVTPELLKAVLEG